LDLKVKKEKSPGTSNTWAQNALATRNALESFKHLDILIDWVGFTFTNTKITINLVLTAFKKYLGIDLGAWKAGRKNYEGYAQSLNYENINIYYMGDEKQGIHVDMTGQGCRFVETKFAKNSDLRKVQSEVTNRIYELIKWQEVIYVILRLKGKFTRLDIAIDDHFGYFTVTDIFRKVLAGELTMKFKSWSPDGYFDSNGQAKQGLSIYFGSDQSRFQILMYEKNKQLGLDEKWTRTELRYFNERANEMARDIVNQKNDREKDIGIIAAQNLAHYIQFRDTGTSKQKTRWNISSFWEEFLKGIEPKRLTTALPDRSIIRMRSWVNKQVSKSLAMMMFAYQDIDDDWMREIMQEGYTKLSKEDLLIIEEYRRMYANEQKNTAVSLASDYNSRQSE
jgi:phage replication initiation protein